MRYLFVATVVAVSVVAPFAGVGAGQELSIKNYQFVSSTPVTVTKANVTYRADLVNTGAALPTVTAALTSLKPTSFTVVAGQGTLSFASVAANSQTTSSNTFTIQVDRSVTFDWANAQWTFQTTSTPPVANPGPNQTVQVGATVTLNGSGSTNPSGKGTLTYNWAITQKPSGSGATISNASSVMPTFVADMPGNYGVLLTVGNGTDSNSAGVMVSTVHSPPVANAGANQTVKLGAAVVLNGSGSSSPDGRPLTYKWTLTPATGSTAALSGANTVNPTFVADKFGTYAAQLIVNDGISDSPASITTISTSHTAPVANAGSNQLVNINSVVQLSGAGSTDVDGNLLSYSWSLISAPAGSTAALSSTTAVNPTFAADRPGTYVAQLIVSDQFLTSAAATVTITTNAVLPPSANAGPAQTVDRQTTVSLSGSGTDPQSLSLKYKWSLITAPAGSAALLSNVTIANPQFVADLPGTYVAQLVVNNGFVDSAASTVTITTTNTPPIANAGPSQSVKLGATVLLDGSASWDPSRGQVTYSWSFMSMPKQSTATLTGANSPSPMFVADQPGTYVVQLIVNNGYTNSSPQTTSVSTGLVLTPNPLNLTTAAPGTITVSLPSAAQSNQVVNLSSDPTIVTIPGSVTILSGSAQASVTVTPVAAGSTTILAQAQGSSIAPGSATVNVSQATIALSPNPLNVGLTRTKDGTITLNAPAPADVQVTLTSSDPTLATVTPSVTIPAGTSTGTFTVTGVALTTGITGPMITASATGYASGTTEVNVFSLGKIFLPTNVTVAPGQSVPYAITLGTAAPSGGATITFSSDSPNASVTPTSVFIPANATAPTTPPMLNGVALGTANISASSPGFIGDTQAVSITTKLSFSPGTLTIFGSNTQNLTLTLSTAAPQAFQINLSSTDPTIATVPASVTMQQGGTTVAVPVTGGGTKNGSTTITATSTLAGVAGATATVTNVFLGQIILPSNASVGLGQSAAFAVSLPGPAPNDVTVNLSSSDSSTLTISPASVTIPANGTAPAVQPQVTGVAVGAASINVSASGYQSNVATVNVTAGLSFPPGPITIPGASTQNITLTLSATTPKALIINLHSDNTAFATVPATVTILAGTNSVGVPVTAVGSSSGSTLIHASAPNIPDASVSVSVTPPPSLILQSGVAVGPNQSATIAVSLPAPAAANVTVNLSSSNPSVATISPASVTISQGATAPAAQPLVVGVNFGSTGITASATGYTPATQQVLVGAAMSFPQGPLTAIAGTVQNVVLTLSAPAPASGLSVNLSSSNTSAATVPATVNFLPNATTVSVPVTGVAAGATSITASTSAPNVTPTSVVVNVGTPGIITVPANTTVGPNQSAAFPFTISPAAPTNGITVTLTSSNPSVASVTSSVFVPAGASAPTTTPIVNGVNFGTTTITVAAAGYISSPANPTVTVGAALSFPAGTTNVTAGGVQNVPLSLSSASPASFTVNLSSSNTGAATVPATVTFPANVTSVMVPVTGVAAGTTTITASTTVTGISSATANISVVNGIILPTNVVAQPGFTSAPFPVTLSSPAPSLVFITLTSSDPSKVALAANGAASTTFSVQAGQTAPTVSTKVFGVDFGSATITASAAGYTSVSTTVQVRSSVVFVPNVVNIVPGGSKLVSLVMATPAPSGITVNLSSDNPSVATLPASASFAANATGVCQEVGGNTCQVIITVNGLTQDSTLIHASAPPFIPDTTATIIVGNPGPPVITTNALVDGQVGLPYSQQLTADQGIVPFTWSIVGGTLPQGLTLDPKTGLISGTPTQTANTDLTFQVTDSATPTPQAGTKTLHLNVFFQGALFITSTSLPNGVQNSPYNAALTAAGGTQPYTWSLASGSVLPNGLSLDPKSGVISGTPTTLVSNLPLTFQVTDSASPAATATKTLSLTIVPATLTITTTSLPDAVVGKPYSAFLQAAGGTGPYTWSIITGSLPGFYTLIASTGQIFSDTGATCICDGRYQMTFQVKDSAGHTATAILAFFMTDGSLQLLTTSIPSGQVGVPYSFTPKASAGTPPYSWTVGGLPQNGLNFDPSTGTVSGTPTAVMNTNLKFTVTDSSAPVQSVSAFFRLIINAGPPVISTVTLPAGAVGTSYSATVIAAGGASPYTWSATGLPAGLNINATTGVISGTPTSAATSNNVVVTVADATTPTAQTATKTFSIVILPQLQITTASPLPGATVNNLYSATVAATGGAGSYTWSATGLPAGLSINSTTGVISGTPTVVGTSNNVVVTVSDAGPPTQTAQRTFTIAVTNGFNIVTNSLPNGAVNLPYSTTVTAANGTGALTWSAQSLPANLTINASTGVISGTPSAAGTSNVQISVSDSATPTPHTANATLALTIVPQLTITTTSLADAVVNRAYSATVAASGGTTPLTWSAAGLPGGLSINASSGVISGTPTVTGSSTATITVTSTNPQQTATANLTIKVVTPPAITTSSLPIGTVGVSYSATMAGTGGTQPYTWTPATLPGGLTMSAGGQISGTPTSAFNGNVTITLTDSGNPALTATATLQLVIESVLQITTASPLPAGTVNIPYGGQPLAATGGQPPYSWSATGLPTGLSMNTSGQIVGTPTVVGTSNSVAVTVKDSFTPTPNTTTKTFSLSIVAPLSIQTTSPLPNGTQLQPYSFQMVAAGGVPSYTWSATGLPPGLGIDGQSGVISGTPTSTGTTTASITVKDTNSASVTQPFSITIVPPSLAIHINNNNPVSIGQSLQSPVTLSVDVAPQADVSLTVTSGNGAVLLLNGGSSGLQPQVTFTLPANQTSIAVNLVGVAIGQTTLSVTGVGGGNNYLGAGNVSVTPSGFALSGPNGPGPSSFVVNQGQPVNLTVSVVQLDAAGNILSRNAAMAPGTSAIVPLVSSSTSCGTITASVTFNAGDANKSATFMAASTGSTTQCSSTLTANPPSSAFGTPAGGANTVTANVNGVGCSLANVTVGRNLAATTNVTLNGLSSGLQVTVQTTDSSKALLACSVGAPQCTGTTPGGPGASLITLTIPTGANRSPDFYVYGISAPATVNYTAGCSTFGSDTKAVTVAASGFVIGGPSGPGAPVTAGIGAATAASLTISSAALDPATLTPLRDGQGNILLQPLAGGLAANPVINLTETDIAPATNVGTISPTSVTLAGLQSSATALFTGTNPGKATLAAVRPGTPAGFSTPASQFSTVTATVFSSILTVCGDPKSGPIQIGFQLQSPCTASVTQPVASDLVVTLTTASNQLLISTNPTQAGQQSTTVVIPAGMTSSNVYYLQALAASGTATYTGSAIGYGPDTGTVAMTQSGVIISGPSDQFVSFSTPLAGGAVPLNAYLYQLDPTKPFSLGANQMLAGGISLTLTLSDDNGAVGTVSSPTITGGTQLAHPMFTPMSAGQTTISLATPTGFSTTGFQTVTATVTP